MERIVRTYEKKLDYLLRLRKKDSESYFVPRTINNKERLDKGYWFLENTYYLNFPLGRVKDWKEKTHNIGLWFEKTRTSYIDLSAAQ